MNALALSAIIFVLTLGGIFLGTLLRRTLPEHYLDEHPKDVVRLGVGLIATIADLILLDNILTQYGPEDHPIREQMRGTVDPRQVIPGLLPGRLHPLHVSHDDGRLPLQRGCNH
jgi:uncharacterized protein YneF (UPF0154 family)